MLQVSSIKILSEHFQASPEMLTLCRMSPPVASSTLHNICVGEGISNSEAGCNLGSGVSMGHNQPTVVATIIPPLTEAWLKVKKCTILLSLDLRDYLRFRGCLRLLGAAVESCDDVTTHAAGLHRLRRSGDRSVGSLTAEKKDSMHQLQEARRLALVNAGDYFTRFLFWISPAILLYSEEWIVRVGYLTVCLKYGGASTG